MSASSGKNRYRVLDALRGIAALGVVFFHITVVLNLPSAPRLDRALHAAGKVGALGVDVFFVLSGICITLVYRRAREFAVGSFFHRRWVRLWPTYAASALVLAAADVFLARRPVGGTPTALLANAVFYPGLPEWAWAFLPRQEWIIPVYWTLAYEAQFYLVFPALVAAWRRYGFFPVHYAGLALSVVAYLLDPDAGLFLNRWFQFLLGSLLCDLFAPRQEGRPFPWKHLLLSNLLVALTGFRGWRWEATLLVQALLLLSFGLNRWGVLRRGEELLARVGVFSYSLYLYHGSFVFLASWLVVRAGWSAGFAHAAWTAPLALALSLAGSWALFRLIEKRFL
ncbi:MAG: acyltransferase [Verrucomicrobiae bacterium]|nr:acyltransferase [Verrucomicrobiae bacterium]